MPSHECSQTVVAASCVSSPHIYPLQMSRNLGRTMCPVACLYHPLSPPFKSDRSGKVHTDTEHSQTQKVLGHFLTNSHLGSDQNNLLTQTVSAHFQVSKRILVRFNCSENTAVRQDPEFFPLLPTDLKKHFEPCNFSNTHWVHLSLSSMTIKSGWKNKITSLWYFYVKLHINYIKLHSKWTQPQSERFIIYFYHMLLIMHFSVLSGSDTFYCACFVSFFDKSSLFIKSQLAAFINYLVE